VLPGLSSAAVPVNNRQIDSDIYVNIWGFRTSIQFVICITYCANECSQLPTRSGRSPSRSVIYKRKRELRLRQAQLQQNDHGKRNPS
jgi:hypothetical protein